MILYGAGGHAKVVIDLLSDQEVFVEGIIDDNPEATGIFNIPVLKNNSPAENAPCIITVGNNSIRKSIAEKFSFEYALAVHRTAVVSKYSTVGRGTVVCASAVINAGTTVGEHVIINTAAVVEHDCIIGDFAHISPNAALAGGVSVGEGTHIGTGAIIIPGVRIGKWCTIGAGTVVIKDVEDYTTSVGNPARIINNKDK